MFYPSAANPILIAFAVIPAAFLLKKVYDFDRLEREPTNLLLGLVLLGVVSTAIAVVLENVGQLIIGFLPEGSLVHSLLLYYGVVALAEEGAKYVLLKRKTWNSPAFNCQFDGVVYAVFVGLGFALWENIQYVALYGLRTALIRAITAIPGHASFAVFMGVWYGMARRHAYAGEYDKAQACQKRAVLVPVLVHGTYDFLATFRAGWSTAAFGLFILIVFIRAYSLVKKISSDDRYIGSQGL